MELFVVATLIGLLPAYIANQKGHSFGGWWLYGALLFIVALPHAILVKPDSAALERKQLNEGHKKCLHCAEMIRQEAIVCRFCGRDLPQPEPAPDLEPAPDPQHISDAQPSAMPSFVVIAIAAVGMVILGLVMFNPFAPRTGYATFAEADKAADEAKTRLGKAEPRTAPAPTIATPSTRMEDSTLHPAVTMENYLRLKDGMSYGQVVAILGKPGTELSRSDLADIVTVMYMWQGNNSIANMNAMFQNDRLTTKAQFGLR